MSLAGIYCSSFVNFIVKMSENVIFNISREVARKKNCIVFGGGAGAIDAGGHGMAMVKCFGLIQGGCQLSQ